MSFIIIQKQSAVSKLLIGFLITGVINLRSCTTPYNWATFWYLEATMIARSCKKL